MPPHNRTSDFMYAAAPLAALMMTYGTRSPRLGALPASLFLILERIFVESPHHDNNGFKRAVGEELFVVVVVFFLKRKQSYLSASST